jgi:probable rRNA maturation factor
MPVKPAGGKLGLNVQRALKTAEREHAPRAPDLRRWARAAVRERDLELAVRLVGEDEGRTLNHDYRGRDYATNVLTFVYGDEAEVEGMPLYGDIVLCVPVIVREAQEQGKAVAAHFAHLMVHGMLHLQGFDHETTADAEIMEALETEILAGLGISDPYA